ncbi:calcium-activated BK potassium channel [Pelomyxa schiedti]|nr:calcium-activated BK potassium channel [Pelomyxa schiedti]
MATFTTMQEQNPSQTDSVEANSTNSLANSPSENGTGSNCPSSSITPSPLPSFSTNLPPPVGMVGFRLSDSQLGSSVAQPLPILPLPVNSNNVNNTLTNNNNNNLLRKSHRHSHSPPPNSSGNGSGNATQSSCFSGGGSDSGNSTSPATHHHQPLALTAQDHQKLWQKLTDDQFKTDQSNLVTLQAVSNHVSPTTISPAQTTPLPSNSLTPSSTLHMGSAVLPSLATSSVNDLLVLHALLVDLIHRDVGLLLLLDSLAARHGLAQVLHRGRLDALSRMLEEAPALLRGMSSAQVTELAAVYSQKRQEGVEQDYSSSSGQLLPLCVLLGFREVQLILFRITTVQLVHLTRNLLPCIEDTALLDCFAWVQDHVCAHPAQAVEQCHKALSQVPSHLQKVALAKCIPDVPQEISSFVLEVFRLPLYDTISFTCTLGSLSNHQLSLLIRIFQMDTCTIITIKRAIAPDPQDEGLELPNSGLCAELPSVVTGGALLNEQSTANPLTQHIANAQLLLQHSGLSYFQQPEFPNSQVSLSVQSHPSDSSPQGQLLLLQQQMKQTSPAKSHPLKHEKEEMREGEPVPSVYSAHTGTVDFSGSQVLATEGTPTDSSHGPMRPRRHKPSGRKPYAHSDAIEPSATSSPLYEEFNSRAAQDQGAITNTTPPSSAIAATSGDSDNGEGGGIIPTQVPYGMMPGVGIGGAVIGLKIARQPPSRTVYQRILRPFPSVMIVGTLPQGMIQNLFIEASLWRSDNETEIPSYLEGTRVVRISTGVFATFKRLKILCTTQQQGSLFCLRFVLKQYMGNDFYPVAGGVALSDPIEVFSHTLYLNERRESGGQPSPSVTEVLPATGSAGTRVAVIGSNFLNTPNLRVAFNNTVIVPTFHEQGTLICVVPTIDEPSPSTVPPGGISGNSITGGGGGSSIVGAPVYVSVRVSNDGSTFSEGKAVFMYC